MARHRCRVSRPRMNSIARLTRRCWVSRPRMNSISRLTRRCQVSRPGGRRSGMSVHCRHPKVFPGRLISPHRRFPLAALSTCTLDLLTGCAALPRLFLSSLTLLRALGLAWLSSLGRWIQLGAALLRILGHFLGRFGSGRLPAVPHLIGTLSLVLPLGKGRSVTLGRRWGNCSVVRPAGILTFQRSIFGSLRLGRLLLLLVFLLRLVLIFWLWLGPVEVGLSLSHVLGRAIRLQGISALRLPLRRAHFLFGLVVLGLGLLGVGVAGWVVALPFFHVAGLWRLWRGCCRSSGFCCRVSPAWLGVPFRFLLRFGRLGRRWDQELPWYARQPAPCCAGPFAWEPPFGPWMLRGPEDVSALVRHWRVDRPPFAAP